MWCFVTCFSPMETGRFHSGDKKHRPEAEVILLTAHGNIPDGVQAIKNGAFDYITKGDDNRKIIPTISRAVDEVEKKERKGRSSRILFVLSRLSEVPTD